MPSLVLELQKEALDSSTSITDLLRKALVVAKKLDISELEEWIESELNGYNVDKEIPQYRLVRGSVKCYNHYHGWQPLIIPDHKKAEAISQMKFNQPISEIESFFSKEKQDTIYVEFSKKVEQMLMYAMEIPLQPALFVSNADFYRIIDAVRNIVLKWSLKLEEDGILGEGMTFTKDERNIASSATYHIKNYIGQILHSQVQQDTMDSTQLITINDINTDKLREFLELIKSSFDQLLLGQEDKDEITAEIKTLESQASSPKPKMRIIKESLHSIRNILEGAMGSVLATELLKQIENLLR